MSPERFPNLCPPLYLQALGSWHDLLERYARRPADALTSMEAVEEGAMLFHRLMQPPASHYLFEEEAEEAVAKTEVTSRARKPIRNV